MTVADSVVKLSKNKQTLFSLINAETETENKTRGTSYEAYPGFEPTRLIVYFLLPSWGHSYCLIKNMVRPHYISYNKDLRYKQTLDHPFVPHSNCLKSTPILSYVGWGVISRIQPRAFSPTTARALQLYI
jgi:hypothetical protein